MTDARSPSVDAGILKAERARLARFLESINKHRKALELAIEQNFDGELDPVEWREAFESSEPDDANRTMVVTGDYSAILNALVEILKATAGSRLLGLLSHRRPHAEQAIEAVRADGGLSDEQAALLNELYVLGGRLEHASPDVVAEDVQQAIEKLREQLPALIGSLLAWLADCGVEFD